MRGGKTFAVLPTPLGGCDAEVQRGFVRGVGGQPFGGQSVSGGKWREQGKFCAAEPNDGVAVRRDRRSGGVEHKWNPVSDAGGPEAGASALFVGKLGAGQGGGLGAGVTEAGRGGADAGECR